MVVRDENSSPWIFDPWALGIAAALAFVSFASSMAILYFNVILKSAY